LEKLMLDELNRELLEVKQKLRIRQKLLDDLDRTQNMLSEQTTRLTELEVIVQKEGADVENLEGLSLTGLFHAVLGDKQTQLEKERQEYLAAKLKYDECKYSVSALERDINDLKARIAGVGDVDSLHRVIVERKEQLISQGSGRNATKLIEFSEALADTQSDIRELKEAIDAGKAVLAGLDGVVGFLKSARNWGTFDMLGGGLIATAVKHSRIDRARESVHQVQQLLRVFQRELADIDSRTDIEIDISSFVTFADYFFDGLIVDWVVQSRIGRSLDSAVQAAEQVHSVVQQLQINLKEAQTKRNVIEQQKHKLIEQA
jgi:hypothetical protein